MPNNQIHTVQIMYSLTVDAAVYVIHQLNSIPELRPQTDEHIDSFLSAKKGTLSYLAYHDGIYSINQGLHEISFYQHRQNPHIYYMYLRLDLEAFMRNMPTICLFRPTPNNVLALQYRYAELIYKLFPLAFYGPPIKEQILGTARYRLILDRLPDEDKWMIPLFDLPYLGLGSVKRIDYSANLYSDHKDLCMELLKKTYLDNRRSLEDHNNHNITTKLKTAKGNKVPTGFRIYDKQRKFMESRYRNIPNIDDLIKQAADIIRFEAVLQPKDEHKSKAWIQSHTRTRYPPDDLNFEQPISGGLIPYLDTYLAEYVLSNEWERHIGYEDWYSDSHIKKVFRQGRSIKALKKDGLTAPKNRRAIEIMSLISQTRYVQEAQKQYVDGVYISRKQTDNTDKEDAYLAGTIEEFQQTVKLIRSKGFQPLRIPDERNIAMIANPFIDGMYPGIDHTISETIDLPPDALAVFEDTMYAIYKILESYKAA